MGMSGMQSAVMKCRVHRTFFQGIVRRLVPATGRTRVDGLEAGSVAQLGVEEGGVVVGDQRMAQRDPGHDRGHDTTIGAQEVGEEPIMHGRHDSSHLMDDVLGGSNGMTTIRRSESGSAGTRR